MGNREQLLAGAKQCLLEKGWARTTVRDISAASGGVSMAAIGYHFGTRDELLTEAFVQAMDEWGDQNGRALAEAVSPDASPTEQFEAMWTATIESFEKARPLLLVGIEGLIQAEHSPRLRELIAAAQLQGRRGLAASFAGIAESDVDEKLIRTIGAVQTALISGVTMQWLLDPQAAPTGPEILEGLRAIMNRVDDAEGHGQNWFADRE